jgi:hypothetical protein
VEYVILGALFMGAVSIALGAYQRGVEKLEFVDSVEVLKEHIELLTSVGSVQHYTITIPIGSRLIFENYTIVASIDGEIKSFVTSYPLTPVVLDPGTYTLKLHRTVSGVEIHVEG